MPPWCKGLPMLCPGLSCGCPAFCPGVRSSPCVQSVRYTACTQLKHGFVLLEHLIRVAIGALCIPVCLCVHLYNLLHAHEVVLAHCVCLCVHLYNLLRAHKVVLYWRTVFVCVCICTTFYILHAHEVVLYWRTASKDLGAAELRAVPGCLQSPPPIFEGSSKSFHLC